jgi:hypothetical protein
MLLLVLIATTALPSLARAERVEPAERVRSFVVVRVAAARASARAGRLRPGEQAHLIETGSEWHQIVLGDGTPGFVSSAWTRVVPDPVPEASAALTRLDEDTSSSFLGRVGSTLRELISFDPPVEFVIREPGPGRTERRHHDPNLPVAGLATLEGSEGKFDVMLVIDTSASTREWAEADVDGDGAEEDVWGGDDSILQAEIAAGIRFVQVARRLPGNHAGQRIRIGVVTFAGDESVHRHPDDRRFDPSPENILALAERDARVRIPLTHDYDAVESVLENHKRIEPSGMTNFAAGIGRALLALDSDDTNAAEDSSRRTARKVMLFLTDGQPRLPFDRDVADLAARHAADLAARAGVRINTFALGRNAVTGKESPTAKRLAKRTGGRYVALEDPADIVSILANTSFSFVDRVKLINRSTRDETGTIGTGIDGSFYGEIDLAEGPNQIELVAVLYDGSEATETLQIHYEHGPSDEALAAALQRIRADNQALVDQIKSRLALEIQAARRRQGAQGRIEMAAEDEVRAD